MSHLTKQASLPMYNQPEIRAAAQAWWKGIAKHMQQQGISDVPTGLTDTIPLDQLWKSEQLFFSQCCGLNVVRGYDKHLSVLMVTDWDAPGCEPYHYASHIVVHEDSPYKHINELKNTVAAINGPDSHSGMTTLMFEAHPFSENGHFFQAIRDSGSHVESLKLIQSKQADVAAIDCVTFALLKRYRPAAIDGIRIISRSQAAPALPYVTAISTDLTTKQRMQTALTEAFADPALTDVREAMLLKGCSFPDLTGSDNPYQAIADGFKFDPRLMEVLIPA
ncbi:MAG: phosphate/phosphite/phosphonate ABC transporter substrate-binding protein [Leucothrix sp.]